jgi:hypothetical protein
MGLGDFLDVQRHAIDLRKHMSHFEAEDNPLLQGVSQSLSTGFKRFRICPHASQTLDGPEVSLAIRQNLIMCLMCLTQRSLDIGSQHRSLSLHNTLIIVAC